MNKSFNNLYCKNGKVGIWYYIACVFIIFVLTLNIIFNIVYSTTQIQGTSMQPFINNGTTAENVCEDFAYINTKAVPDYQDIIVISCNNGYNIIKRAIAFEGDLVTIKVDNGKFGVWLKKINESSPTLLAESYVKNFEKWTNNKLKHYDAINNINYENTFYQTYLSTGNGVALNNVLYYQIPENHIFYLGDNRANSSDSRDFSKKTTDIDDVVGVAEIIVDKGCVNDGGQFFRKMWAVLTHFWKEIGNF